MLKTIKILTITPTCFGSRRNHHQGAISCLAKATIMILLCLSLMTWSMLWRHTSLLCKHAVHGRGRHLFKCLWTVLSYLDIFIANWHRCHGLMYCRFCFMLGWLSEFVLLCFGKLVVDSDICRELVYSTVQRKRLEISGLCNGTQRTARPKTSRTDILWHHGIFGCMSQYTR